MRLQATQAEEHGDKASAAALREQAAMFEAGTLTIDENTGAVKTNTGEVVESTDALKEETAAVEESGLSWMKRNSVAEEAVNTAIKYSEEARERAKASAEAEKAALETTRQAYEDNYNSIKDTLSQKLSLWDAFDGGEDVTVEQMIANLQSQNEGITQYKQEMEEVIAAYGDELGPALITTLQSMGPMRRIPGITCGSQCSRTMPRNCLLRWVRSGRKALTCQSRSQPTVRGT